MGGKGLLLAVPCVVGIERESGWWAWQGRNVGRLEGASSRQGEWAGLCSPSAGAAIKRQIPGGLGDRVPPALAELGAGEEVA